MAVVLNNHQFLINGKNILKCLLLTVKNRAVFYLKTKEKKDLRVPSKKQNGDYET